MGQGLSGNRVAGTILAKRTILFIQSPAGTAVPGIQIYKDVAEIGRVQGASMTDHVDLICSSPLYDPHSGVPY